MERGDSKRKKVHISKGVEEWYENMVFTLRTTAYRTLVGQTHGHKDRAMQALILTLVSCFIHLLLPQKILL